MIQPKRTPARLLAAFILLAGFSTAVIAADPPADAKDEVSGKIEGKLVVEKDPNKANGLAGLNVSYDIPKRQSKAGITVTICYKNSGAEALDLYNPLDSLTLNVVTNRPAGKEGDLIAFRRPRPFWLVDRPGASHADIRRSQWPFVIEKAAIDGKDGPTEEYFSQDFFALPAGSERAVTLRYTLGTDGKPLVIPFGDYVLGIVSDAKSKRGTYARIDMPIFSVTVTK